MTQHDRIGRLSVVVYDGHFDKIHYALAMASSAAALDMPVTLFFTMDACAALMIGPHDRQPRWHALPVSGADGAGTSADVTAGIDMDNRFRAQKIATFEDLLAACVELGVTFMVCEMGLKARNLSADELRTDIPVEPGGLVTFLSNATKDGSIVFI